MATVVVVGLGPAGPELVTPQTSAIIAATSARFVRTLVHPAAALFADRGFEVTSFDELYESLPTFDDVYLAITERLVAAAERHGRVLYAVPGSPRVLERSVEHLLGDPRVDVELVPAMSFLDLAWARLGIDPVEAGVRLVDGHTFAVSAAGERGPLLVAHCHNRRVLSDIKLAVDEPGDTPVTVIARLGCPDERISEVTWADLDREIEPDHLTSLWIGHLASPVATELVRFDELVRRLRDECPWDSSQTHQSLRRHLVEEAYELVDAIDGHDPETGDGAEHLEEELGDLLFQVFLHAAIAAENGWFELADVARTVHDKLFERHPHVFGEEGPATIAELTASWEARKVVEKDRGSVMDGVPSSLPALAFAEKVVKKAAALGVEVTSSPGLTAALGRILAAAPEEIDGRSDLPGDTGLVVGRALLELVGLARRHGIDPEMAMRARALEVAARVRRFEALAAESDIDVICAEADTVESIWRATS